MTRRTQKEIGLISTIIIYSIITLWFLARSFEQSTSPLAVAMLVAAGVVWVALVAFACAVVSQRSVLVMVIGIPIIVAAVGKLSLGAIVAAVPLSAIIMLARWRIQDEMKDRLKAHTVRMFRAGTRWLTFGFLFSAAGLAVNSIASSLRDYTITIPQQVVESVLLPIEPLLREAVQGYSPAVIAVTTEIMNQYLNTIIHTNPLLTAFTALVTLLFLSRILLPALTWPSLSALALLTTMAKRWHFVYVAKKPVTSEHLQLENPAEQATIGNRP